MYVCMYGNALCGVVCPAPLRTSHVCLTPKLTVVDQRGLITNPKSALTPTLGQPNSRLAPLY